MANKTNLIDNATNITRRRYQRLAPFYDLMEFLPEQRYIPWRRRLWSRVSGPRVLEIGVGTGKNMPFYPAGMQIAAIDLAPGMLDRARARAGKLNQEVDLSLGDAQSLDFSDESFDSVVATFVFCSVPDPVLGLKEARRVLKNGGQLVLLEHVRSELFLLGELMDLLNPVFLTIMGPNINRRTVQNVPRAGLEIEQVEDLGRADIFKLIFARKTAQRQ